MSTTIYYFSATGNSLTTAKRLAAELEDCRLVPVAGTKSLSKVIETSETVGFVFPVYYGDMPYPVREMICKMVFQPDSYIFICPTYRGHAGDVAKKIDQLLRTRAQKLSLALGLPMPGNSFINPPEVDEKYLQEQDAAILAQLDSIRSKTVQDYSEPNVLTLRPVDFPNNFRGIMTDETCTGCGVCTEVCPMNNITLQDGKALIGDDCASCLACFHWCPVEAIYMSKAEEIARRAKYRHPEVTLKEIAAQKTL